MIKSQVSNDNDKVKKENEVFNDKLLRNIFRICKKRKCDDDKNDKNVMIKSKKTKM